MAFIYGTLILNEARAHYAECGAALPRFLLYVRKHLYAEE